MVHRTIIQYLKSLLFKGLYNGTPQSTSTLQRRTGEGRLNRRETERVYWIQSVYLGSKLLFGKDLICCHLGQDTAKLKNTLFLYPAMQSYFSEHNHHHDLNWTELLASYSKPDRTGWGNWAFHCLFLLRYSFWNCLEGTYIKIELHYIHTHIKVF